MIKISDLISILNKYPSDSEVIIRDLNGLDWFLEEANIKFEGDSVIIDTQDINVVF